MLYFDIQITEGCYTFSEKLFTYPKAVALMHACFRVYEVNAFLQQKMGVPSAVGFPHCAGSGEGLFLSPKPYPHKCAEAEARTRDLPVTNAFLQHLF